MTISVETTLPSTKSLPIIDLAPWFRDDSGKEFVASQVRFACQSVGFFYIKNHGVPESLIEGAFQAAHDFFILPDEIKSRVHYEQTHHIRGYIPLRGEGASHGGDLKEAFDCAPEYTPPPDIGSSAIQASTLYWEHMNAPNLWPETPAHFRNAVENYLESLVQLGRVLFAIFAVSLGLAVDYFDDKLDLPIAEVRLLRYPSQPMDAPASIGIGAHCDCECFTILAQSNAGGIQVRNITGQWLLAGSIPGTFLITIGDMLARWSNDVFSATPHCVIHVSEEERYSLPFFFGPDFNTTITCLKTCQSSDRPARYQPVVAGDYLVRRPKGSYKDQPRIV